jgi:adenylate cyclase
MQRDSLRRILERGLYGLLAGVSYALINLGSQLQLILICSAIGLTIGLGTGYLDRWLFFTRLRRQPFLVILLVRTLAYLLLISLTLAIFLGVNVAIATQSSLGELFLSPMLLGWITDGHFIYLVLYSFLLLLAFQFFILVSRLLGPNVLINYMLGRYHQPKEEERIFMFMDLRASTTIAERLGHLKWHYFLNDFFYDIAKPVHRSQGEIYQYVGDEVVISWPVKKGLRNCNCIRCFFGIWNRMAERQAYYIRKYGYEPVFKAGYHVGKVIIGEIGDHKRDIVFHGDTVNTASRIQAECNHYNRRLLLSNTLLDGLELGEEYTSEYITKIKLRGKEEVIALHSLDPLAEIANHPPAAPVPAPDLEG